jgi:hypothetical protein
MSYQDPLPELLSRDNLSAEHNQGISQGFHKLQRTLSQGKQPINSLFLWGLLIALIMALTIWIMGSTFLSTMNTLYTTSIQSRLPPNDLIPYQETMVFMRVASVGPMMVSLLLACLTALLLFKRVRFKLVGIFLIGLIIIEILATLSITPIFTNFISSSNRIQPTTEMTRSSFTPATLNIFTGETVHFRNTSGITQTLCVGSHQECANPNATAPEQLRAPGLSIQSGQTINLVFDTSRTYQIISTTTPALTLTVVVTDSAPNDGNALLGNRAPSERNVE